MFILICFIFLNDYFISVLLVINLILVIVGADEVTRRHHMAQWQLALEWEARGALWWGNWKRRLGWRKSLRLLGHRILEPGTTGRLIGRMRSTRWSSGKCSWTRKWGSSKMIYNVLFLAWFFCFAVFRYICCSSLLMCHDLVWILISMQFWINIWLLLCVTVFSVVG